MHVKVEEIANLLINFGRLGILIDSTFSTPHRKIGKINEEKIATLKHDLILAGIKWHELRFSLTTKFHAPCENVTDLLLESNGFCEIEEDTIE